MSGWIKFDKDMAEDPRLIQAAEFLSQNYVLAKRSSGGGGDDLSNGDALRFASNALRGALVTLWCYADTHIRDDDTLAVTSQSLDALVGLEGFCEAVAATEWIRILDDGTVELPGYCAKNALIAKRKRAEDNKARQARFRARNNTKGNGVHTPSVTRYGVVTKCVDRDLYQDQDIREEKDRNPSASATPTRKPLQSVPREATPEWFLDFKLAYPSRAGDPGWRKALRAANERMREGHRCEEFIAGARRYAVFCESTGKVGTEFVKQASTFLGPDKPFLQPWGLPASKADIRLAGNLAVANDFIEGKA